MAELSKIYEIQNDITRISRVIDDIIGEEEKSKNADNIDINRIEKLARQAVLKNHFIYHYDAEIVKKYCILLASAVRFMEKNDKKIRQYYFIARILYGNNAEIPLDEIVVSAELVDIKDFSMLHKELQKDIKLFLFDALLLTSLDGDMDEKQTDYYCELLAYVDVSKKDLENLFKVCACVLSGKDNELYQYASSFPISKLSCYLQNPIKGEVVTSLKELKQGKEKDVTVVGVNVKNMELDLDTYGKKNLRFLDCKFKNVSSICGVSTRIVFENCYFGDCKKESELHSSSEYEDGVTRRRGYALFSFGNADFINCSFERCSHINHWDATVFLKIDSGKIENCRFISCLVGSTAVTNDKGIGSYNYFVYCSLIYVDKVSVTNTKFEECIAIGGENGGLLWLARSSDCQYLNLIYCKGGNIEKCEFLSCGCSGGSDERTKKNNFLINSIGAMEKGNKFTECTATGNVGTAEWGI